MDNIKIGNSSFIKNLNQSSIFRLIHDYGPISRKELSEKTDYSAATISNHVKTLIETGFVIEKEKGVSSGGRKPIFLTINPNKGYIFAVDIEVRKVKIFLFNLKLNVENKVEFNIKKGKPPLSVLNEIVLKINKIMKSKNINLYDIFGIGIAVPGLVDKERSILKFAPNLGWYEENIGSYFYNKFKVPIIIENEANAAAIGEKKYYYDNKINMVYVSINEGIGCGLIFNGELYRGASGNAGEFGHIIIDSESGRSCHCGNKGCWETLASEKFIYDMYTKNIKDNIKSIDDIYKTNIDDNLITMNIINQVGENIGIGLANIINSISPELVVIGGNILQIEKYISDYIHKSVKNKTLKLNYEKADIKFSKLKELATVYGLAKIIFDQNLLANNEF